MKTGKTRAGASRRDFLKWSGASALGLWTACGRTGGVRPDGATDGSITSADVIVIGAGIAGIAAARAIHDAGKSVILLEARDRIGGRIHSDHRWPDAAAELGAAWIHGSTGNPLVPLATAAGAQTVSTNYNSQLIYGTNGRELTGSMLTSLQARYTQVQTAVRSKISQLKNGGMPDVSLGSVITSVLNGLTLTALAFVQWMYASEIEDDFAGNLDQLSAFFYDEGASLVGPDLLFPNGYDQIITPMAAPLDIRLSTVVSKISYGTPDAITIVTSAGDYQCKRCVCTLPLGVLKAGSVQFDPPLPAAKSQAIDRLGMGQMHKAIVRFPQVFWSNAHIISLVSQPPGELAWSLSMARYPGAAPVLVALHSGAKAVEVEAMSIPQLTDYLLVRLRKTWPSAPAPVEVLSSKWGADPFSLGCYSYLAVGSTSTDRSALATSVGTQLFFAGEATHVDSPALVHGAYLSGTREAQNVVTTL